MENPDFLTIARMMAIYLHVLALAIAAVAVAFGDFAIFARERIDMKCWARPPVATIALAVLWITGLAVIGMDTGFDTELLATKPKLLAKLTVVAVLTVNSLACICLPFRVWRCPRPIPPAGGGAAGVFGAISATVVALCRLRRRRQAGCCDAGVHGFHGHVRRADAGWHRFCDADGPSAARRTAMRADAPLVPSARAEATFISSRPAAGPPGLQPGRQMRSGGRPGPATARSG